MSFPTIRTRKPSADELSIDTLDNVSNSSIESPRSSLDEVPPSPIQRLHEARMQISSVLKQQKDIQRNPCLSRFIPKRPPRDKPLVPADRELDSFKNEQVTVWYVSRSAKPKIGTMPELRKVVLETKSQKTTAWMENIKGEGLICYIEKNSLDKSVEKKKHGPHPLQKCIITSAEEDLDGNLSLYLEADHGSDDEGKTEDTLASPCSTPSEISESVEWVSSEDD